MTLESPLLSRSYFASKYRAGMLVEFKVVAGQAVAELALKAIESDWRGGAIPLL